MPKIQEYNSQVTPIRSTPARAAGGADFGAGIGQSVAQLGNVLQQKEERDANLAAEQTLSDSRVKITQLMQDMQTGAPQGAPGFTQGFLDTYDEMASEALDQAKTPTARKSLQAGFAQMRAGFATQAIHFEAEASAQMQVDTVDKVASNAANVVLSDPTQLDESLAQVNRVIDGAAGLNGEQRAKMKQDAADQLHISAVEGVINMNPQLGKNQLEGGQWDNRLPKGAKEQLLAKADQGISAEATQQRLAQAAAEKAQKAHYNNVANTFLDLAQQGKLTTKTILASDLPAFGETSKQTFLTMLDKTAHGEVKTNPATFNSLFDRIHADYTNKDVITDSTQLLKYVGGPHGITMDDYLKLSKEIEDRKLPNGTAIGSAKKMVVNDAKAQLDKSTSIIADPLGQHQLNLFTDWMNKAYQDGIAAGKTPQDLLNPTSKDYLGNGIGMFQRTLDEKLQSVLGQYGGEQMLPKTVTFQMTGGQTKSLALTDPQVSDLVSSGAKAIIPQDIQQKVLAPLAAKLAATGMQSLTAQEQAVVGVYQRLGAFDQVIKQAVTSSRMNVTDNHAAEQQALNQARAAIAHGADAAKVKERLKAMGYDPGKL